MTGINNCFQRGNKFALLHQNFNFLKNIIWDFEPILGYIIFTLILNFSKTFEKKLLRNFLFYLFIMLIIIISKPGLVLPNFVPQSQLRKYSEEDFYSVEILNLCKRLHDPYHHIHDCYVGISRLKCTNYSKRSQNNNNFI